MTETAAIIPTETPREACAAPFPPEQSATLEVMGQLLRRTCPTCGCLFALPVAVFVDRLHVEGEIYCPCGHAIHLGKNPHEERESLTLAAAELVIALDRVRGELSQARETIARLEPGPEKPVGLEEIKRRMRLIAARAEWKRANGFDKDLVPVCRFCGKKSTTDLNFMRHLHRKHTDEIAKLPASFFD